VKSKIQPELDLESIGERAIASMSLGSFDTPEVFDLLGRDIPALITKIRSLEKQLKDANDSLTVAYLMGCEDGKAAGDKRERARCLEIVKMSWIVQAMPVHPACEHCISGVIEELRKKIESDTTIFVLGDKE
jgi:hypothetical protein